MGIGNLLRSIARGYTAIDKAVFKREAQSIPEKIESGFVLVILACLFVCPPIALVIATIGDSWSNHRFSHLSAAEHLAHAKAACGSGSQCLNIPEAVRHLSKIPQSAPEYQESFKLWTAIGQQSARETEQANLKTVEAHQRSWEQAQRNFQGQAHDTFSCATSTRARPPIVSFDDSQSWWKDDGRCEVRLQRKRDEDAEINSYWSTTVRVDTDMDSFWLPDEERTCQTLPDQKGRVATVLCDSKGHANHNIPVKFWGGVDRDTTSDWKCRRESGEFVCRAID